MVLSVCRRSVFIGITCFPMLAFAQQDAMPGTSFSLLLGLGGAGMASISQQPLVESNKYGFELNGHALGSLAVSHVVMDIGVGWMLSNIYADGGASRVATSKGIYEKARKNI